MRRDAAGPYSLEALRAVAVPTLFSTDAATWRARLIAWFEAESGRALQPMQVEMLLIEALAYALAVAGEEAQAVAEQHLVVSANEAGLARLAANRSTPRLPAAKARVTLRFARVPGVVGAIYIPRWTRAGQGVVFATLKEASLAPDAASIDVAAEAETAGAAGDGVAPGQIGTLLDPVAGVSVVNVTTSEGGADQEGLEAWRLRVANAFARVSRGGPRAWDRETAVGVSSAIADVAVIRPQPCYIDLYVLTADGVAGAALKAQVAAAFATPEALDIRFGDLVALKDGTVVVVAPRLVLRVRGAPSDIAARARALAQPILDDWSSRFAALVAPSEVEAAVKSLPGVVDAELADVGFRALGEREFLRPAALVVEVVAL